MNWLVEVPLQLICFFGGGHVVPEVVGYFWHRFGEHLGVFGDTVRFRHWVHHEVDYPIGEFCRKDARVTSLLVFSRAWFVTSFLKSVHWFCGAPKPKGERECITTPYKSAGSWTWYVLAALMGAVIYVVLPPRYAVSVLAGSAVYSWWGINYLHEAFHIRKHWLMRFRWFRRCRRRHREHHWKCGVNFGIGVYWVDWLCGTLCDKIPAKPENVFPGFKPEAMGLAKN